MSGVAACSVSAERYNILSVKIGAGYKPLLVKPFSVMSKRNSEILTLRSYVNLSNTVQVEKVRKYASSTLNVNDTYGDKMLRHFFPVVEHHFTTYQQQLSGLSQLPPWTVSGWSSTQGSVWPSPRIRARSRTEMHQDVAMSYITLFKILIL